MFAFAMRAKSGGTATTGTDKAYVAVFGGHIAFAHSLFLHLKSGEFGLNLPDNFSGLLSYISPPHSGQAGTSLATTALGLSLCTCLDGSKLFSASHVKVWPTLPRKRT